MLLYKAFSNLVKEWNFFFPALLSLCMYLINLFYQFSFPWCNCLLTISLGCLEVTWSSALELELIIFPLQTCSSFCSKYLGSWSLASSYSSFKALPKWHILSCAFPALSSEISCFVPICSFDFFIHLLFYLRNLSWLWAIQKQGLYHVLCNVAAIVMHGVVYTVKMCVESIYIHLPLSLSFVNAYIYQRWDVLIG